MNQLFGFLYFKWLKVVWITIKFLISATQLNDSYLDAHENPGFLLFVGMFSMMVTSRRSSIDYRHGACSRLYLLIGALYY